MQAAWAQRQGHSTWDVQYAISTHKYSPWLLQFGEIAWVPHLVLSIGEIIGAVVTEVANTICHGNFPQS